jgi:hypothetical protein
VPFEISADKSVKAQWLAPCLTEYLRKKAQRIAPGPPRICVGVSVKVSVDCQVPAGVREDDSVELGGWLMPLAPQNLFESVGCLKTKIHRIPLHLADAGSVHLGLEGSKPPILSKQIGFEKQSMMIGLPLT